LSTAVLRQRAIVIRDALGQADCPPLPSGQTQDMIHWILHMQEKLTNNRPSVARKGHGVPPTFVQETEGRPIAMKREPSPRSRPAPFGPRVGSDLDAARDHYDDLLMQRNEFKEAPVHGIQTMRVGGEGKKHIFPQDNFENSGVSKAQPRGIQTMKNTPEGRRYLQCKDHLSWELHGGGEEPPATASRVRPENTPHVSRDQMASPGVSGPRAEPHIGGERRKHLDPGAHMVSPGVCDVPEAPRPPGRRHLDKFSGGSRNNFGGSHSSYSANWKQDPSKLQGASLII